MCSGQIHTILFFFLLSSTLFSSRKIPVGRLHTTLPSPIPAGFLCKGNDLSQLFFCCSHRFVIRVPSNSALSYMINYCHMWLVLSDPLCRGRIWAFAREKETYAAFKSSVQMNKKDWSQIFVGWLILSFSLRVTRAGGILIKDICTILEIYIFSPCEILWGKVLS